MADKITSADEFVAAFKAAEILPVERAMDVERGRIASMGEKRDLTEDEKSRVQKDFELQNKAADQTLASLKDKFDGFFNTYEVVDGKVEKKPGGMPISPEEQGVITPQWNTLVSDMRAATGVKLKDLRTEAGIPPAVTAKDVTIENIDELKQWVSHSPADSTQRMQASNQVDGLAEKLNEAVFKDKGKIIITAAGEWSFRDAKDQLLPAAKVDPLKPAIEEINKTLAARPTPAASVTTSPDEDVPERSALSRSQSGLAELLTWARGKGVEQAVLVDRYVTHVTELPHGAQVPGFSSYAQTQINRLPDGDADKDKWKNIQRQYNEAIGKEELSPNVRALAGSKIVRNFDGQWMDQPSEEERDTAANASKKKEGGKDGMSFGAGMLGLILGMVFGGDPLIGLLIGLLAFAATSYFSGGMVSDWVGGNKDKAPPPRVPARQRERDVSPTSPLIVRGTDGPTITPVSVTTVTPASATSTVIDSEAQLRAEIAPAHDRLRLHPNPNRNRMNEVKAELGQVVVKGEKLRAILVGTEEKFTIRTHGSKPITGGAGFTHVELYRDSGQHVRDIRLDKRLIAEVDRDHAVSVQGGFESLRQNVQSAVDSGTAVSTEIKPVKINRPAAPGKTAAPTIVNDAETVNQPQAAVALEQSKSKDPALKGRTLARIGTITVADINGKPQAVTVALRNSGNHRNMFDDAVLLDQKGELAKLGEGVSTTLTFRHSERQFSATPDGKTMYENKPDEFKALLASAQEHTSQRVQVAVQNREIARTNNAIADTLLRGMTLKDSPPPPDRRHTPDYVRSPLGKASITPYGKGQVDMRGQNSKTFEATPNGDTIVFGEVVFGNQFKPKEMAVLLQDGSYSRTYALNDQSPIPLKDGVLDLKQPEVAGRFDTSRGNARNQEFARAEEEAGKQKKAELAELNAHPKVKLSSQSMHNGQTLASIEISSVGADGEAHTHGMNAHIQQPPKGHITVTLSEGYDKSDGNKKFLAEPLVVSMDPAKVRKPPNAENVLRAMGDSPEFRKKYTEATKEITQPVAPYVDTSSPQKGDLTSLVKPYDGKADMLAASTHISQQLKNVPLESNASIPGQQQRNNQIGRTTDA